MASRGTAGGCTLVTMAKQVTHACLTWVQQRGVVLTQAQDSENGVPLAPRVELPCCKSLHIPARNPGRTGPGLCRSSGQRLNINCVSTAGPGAEVSGEQVLKCAPENSVFKT